MYEKTPNPNANSGPARSAKEHADRLATEAHRGIDSAADAARPTADRLASGAHRAVENAEGMASRGAEALGKAGARGEELIATGSDYVREHPLFTLGVALAAGFVLSRLLGSR